MDESTIERLERLQGLRERGAITDEEFAKAKGELLAETHVQPGAGEPPPGSRPYVDPAVPQVPQGPWVPPSPPWIQPEQGQPARFLGMPIWVAIVLGAVGGIVLLSALAAALLAGTGDGGGSASPSGSPAAAAPGSGKYTGELTAARAALPTNSQSGFKLGRDDAPIKLTIYEDFQCPFCLAYTATEEPQIIENYVKTGKVQLVYQNLPILGTESVNAARGAVCAAAQNKFWEYHSALFTLEAKAGQATDEKRDVGRFADDKLEQIARDLGVDGRKFSTCYGDPATTSALQDQLRKATSLGFRSTPSFTINELPFGSGAPATYDGWVNLLDQAVANPPNANAARPTSAPISAPKTFARADQVIDPSTKKYTATLKTDKGDIVMNLLADKAPRTVNTFVFLVQNKFYDGVAFHRVVRGFVVQGGDPTGTGGGGPGFQTEEDQNDLKNTRGMVSMAKAGPVTNFGSQFFINLVDNAQLDSDAPNQKRFYPWALVTPESMAVVDRLLQGDVIRAATITEAPK